MRSWAIALMVVALGACGSPVSQASVDEALAEAERANARADDLESRIVDLEGELEDLESQFSSEASEREAADAALESSISSHYHY